MKDIHYSGNGHEATFSTRELEELLGEQHIAGSTDTPLRPDAFELPDEQKIKIIAKHFKEIMQTLGLDLNDDSLRGTPTRVAKMYVTELFGGLNPVNKPDISLFENKYRYRQILVEKNIRVQSCCEHHFVPIIGKAHIGYVSSGRVIGLSKLNRIVDYYARRPQVQERLTVQIGRELRSILCTDDVAVVIEAEHLCIGMRGIKDEGSSTVTADYGGCFRESSRKEEFLSYTRQL